MNLRNQDVLSTDPVFVSLNKKRSSEPQCSTLVRESSEDCLRRLRARTLKVLGEHESSSAVRPELELMQRWEKDPGVAETWVVSHHTRYLMTLLAINEARHLEHRLENQGPRMMWKLALELASRSAFARQNKEMVAEWCEHLDMVTRVSSAMIRFVSETLDPSEVETARLMPGSALARRLAIVFAARFELDMSKISQDTSSSASSMSEVGSGLGLRTVIAAIPELVIGEKHQHVRSALAMPLAQLSLAW